MCWETVDVNPMAKSEVFERPFDRPFNFIIGYTDGNRKIKSTVSDNTLITKK